MLILQPEERILSYLLGDCWVSYSILIRTVLCFKYSVGSLQVFVITVLRVCPHDDFHRALWAFHKELIDFSCVVMSYHLLNCVESHTLSYHILASVAPHMERCLVSDGFTIDVLPLMPHERLPLLDLTLFWRDLGRVVVLREVKVVCTRSSKCTHYLL